MNWKSFWQRKKKAAESDESTDEELPLNAAVLSDVYQEKIKLVEIKKRVKLNPFASLKKLKRHDEFFTRKLIFSNTVRSMINIPDEADQNKDQLADKKRMDMPLLIEEPDVVWTYDVNDTSIGGIAEDYVPSKKN
ncbi:hypothetical protein M3Y97_00074000 [Aphelenchoides bicaudatus]|nr:hypothetical protein M3Y97_00074000 [Aphelenchoides bicaudatus]